MVMSAGTGLGILFVFAMAVVSVVGEPVGSPGVPDGRERCAGPGETAEPRQQQKDIEQKVRGWVRKAQDLARADQRKEGIALLTKSLPELEAAEHAGLRAYQLAHLARIYMEDGERDWAVTLLERIREDPHLDESQFLQAEALAEGRVLERGRTGRLRTRKRIACLSIESEGCFELRVGWQEMEGEYRPVEGGRLFTHWFSLGKDPFKMTNLSEEEKGVFPGTGMTWDRLEILEDTAARCRLRWAVDDDSGRFADYTIYPTGQVYGLLGGLESEDGAGGEEGVTVPGRMAFHKRLHPRPERDIEGVPIHLLDYREPARVRVPGGEAVKGEAGDLDGDGFNESEGCYVVSGSRTVILIAGERERIQPVIKFRQPAVNGLPQVIANGLVADRSAYNLAWAEHGALLLHWRASIPAGERLELLLR